MNKQWDALQQVKRKVEDIEQHPELFRDAIRPNATWNRIVPVVLNGSPFSLSGPIDDAYFHDSSALHRFFEDGFIARTMVGGQTMFQ